MTKKIFQLLMVDKTHAVKTFVDTLQHIKTTLLDENKRAELVNLLPTLVERIDMNLAGREYTVKLTTGVQSEWIHC